MKLLPDGGKAFYAIDWELRGIGVYFILFSLLLFLFSPKDPLFPFLTVYLGVGGIAILYLSFREPPICIVYQEKLVINNPNLFHCKKTELFWDQIKQFYLKETRIGIRYLPIKNLVLDTATGLTEVQIFHQIKRKERELLLCLLLEYGIPKGPEIKS